MKTESNEQKLNKNVQDYFSKCGKILLVSVTVCKLLSIKLKLQKNSIRDARTPQPEDIVFNTMRYRSNETVQRLGHFQCSVSYIKVQIMFMLRK